MSLSALHRVSWGARLSIWAGVALSALFAYAPFLSSRVSGERPRAFLVLLCSIVVAELAVKRADARVRKVLIATTLCIAPLSAPHDTPLTALVLIGAMTTSVLVSLRAIEEIRAPVSLVTARQVRSQNIRIGLALFSLLIAVQVVVPWARRLDGDRAATRAWESGALALAAIFSMSLAVASRRRLELGVFPRMLPNIVVGIAAALLASALSVTAVLSPLRAFSAAALALSAFATWTAIDADPVRIARASRRLAVYIFLVVLISLFASALVRGSERALELAVIAAVAAAIACAARIESLEMPLLPARGQWQHAARRAELHLFRHDPASAIREVLFTLRDPVGPLGPSPRLWLSAKGSMVRIDAAGYIHYDDDPPPPELLTFAANEPWATLRGDTLEALEVRRPDVRHVADWMRKRGLLAATVVTLGGEPEGILFFAGLRATPVAIEEVVAFKDLADRLGAACHVTEFEERVLARERKLAEELAVTEEALRRVRGERALEIARRVHEVSLRAASAPRRSYAPAARLAEEELDERVAMRRPVAIVSSSGSRPLPLIARAHLAGPNLRAPFIVVDGAATREHDDAHWRDPLSSPLKLADLGLLVLVDAAALPLDLQKLIGAALLHQRAPWDAPLDVALAMTTLEPPTTLASRGRLDRILADRLGDALERPITLPHLRDRPEDLRAIVGEKLARAGLRLRGEPSSLDLAAFATVIDGPWEGDERALDELVRKLVERSDRPVISAAILSEVLRSDIVDVAQVSAANALNGDE